jgi:hypothetical protein
LLPPFCALDPIHKFLSGFDKIFERRNNESETFRVAKPKPYTGTYFIGRKKTNYCPPAKPV